MKRLNKYFRFLYDWVRIWRMEMDIIFHDGGVLIFCLAIPFGYPLLYTYIYNTELMRDVPITIVDHSHTSLSREFIRKVDASQWVKVTGLSNDVPDAKQSLKEDMTYGFLVIPNDFSDNINGGKQAFVGMYGNMSGLLYYKGILIAATDASLEMNRDIKIQKSGFSTSTAESISASPVLNEEVCLFNTQQGFASFLIPAVLILIIQQTLLLGIGMAGGTAAERREYKKLVFTSRYNKSTLNILGGRASAYFFIYCINAVFITCAVPHMFGLPQLSRASDLLIFMIPFILDCIFFAMALSVILRNREMSILIFVVTSVPLLFISGISWPATAIPPSLKAISYLFPSTFGINGFIRMNTMGATLQQVLPEFKALWIQTIAYGILAYISCKVLIYFDIKRDEKGFKSPKL